MSIPTKLGEEYYKVLKIHGQFGLLNGIREKVVDELILMKGMKVLDIGSGDGLFAITFSKKLSRGMVVGIDIDQDEIQDAEEHARSTKATCEFKKMDAYKLEFKNEYFDIVGCFLSLEEICSSKNDLEKLLVEMTRVIKKGGQIVLCVLTLDEDNKSQKLLMKILEEFGWKFFKKSDFIKILQKRTFSIRSKIYDANLHLKSEEALKFLDFGFGIKDLPNWESVWRKYKSLIEKIGLEMKVTAIFGLKS